MDSIPIWGSEIFQCKDISEFTLAERAGSTIFHLHTVNCKWDILRSLKLSQLLDLNTIIKTTKNISSYSSFIKFLF